MAHPSIKAALDQLRAANQKERASLSQAAAAARQPHSPIGLRFGPAARVLDLTTGIVGFVQSADRDPKTGFDVYRVQLIDARIVYRTDRELEPAPAAPPPLDR